MSECFYGGSVGNEGSLWFVLLFFQAAKLLCNATGYSAPGDEERRSPKHDIGAEISCVLSIWGIAFPIKRKNLIRHAMTFW